MFPPLCLLALLPTGCTAPAGSADPGAQAPQTTLSVLAEDPEGKPLRVPSDRIRVLVRGRDDLGWPTRYELKPQSEPSAHLGDSRATFDVPQGSDVVVALLVPRYQLVEELVAVGSKPRDVSLRLSRAESLATLAVDTAKSGGSPIVGILGHLRIRSPRFGLTLAASGLDSKGNSPIRLPIGAYDIEWPRATGLCGNAPTFPETEVPRRKVVRLVEGPNVLRFREFAASQLSLEVRRASAAAAIREADFGKRAMDPLQWEADPPRDFLRAKLIQGEEEIHLSWTWSGLGRRGYQSVLPLDVSARLGIPVQPGSYTLVLAGQGMQEQRLPLVLEAGRNHVVVHLEVL